MAEIFDPSSGQWIDLDTGTTLNNTQQSPQPQPRVINTPNSSTGEPIYQDPSAPRPSPQFATPQGGQLTTTTPNSSTGAPAPGIRTVPSTELVPAGRGTATDPNGYIQNLLKNYGANYVRQNWKAIAGSLGLGDLALPAALATIPLVASTTSTAPRRQDEAPRWSWPAPAGSVDPFSNPTPTPVTAPGFLPQQRGGAVPPFPPTATPPPLPPGGPPLPPVRPQAAIPPLPISPGARAPAMQRTPGGGATPAPAGPAPPLAPSMVDLGHWQATAGNARGNPTWVPGVYGSPANPSPQLFRGWTTAQGAPLQGQGPSGAQNYYTPGSAPMGPGDWTGTGMPAGPLAANAGGNARGGGATPYNVAGIFNNLPNNVFNGGGGGATGPTQIARAPTMQRQGFQPGKFFRNPANWQYPNVQM